MFAKMLCCGVGVLLVLGATSAVVGQTPRSLDERRPRISQGALQDGDEAPDFALQDIEGTKEVKLSELRGKPVVLIFGSCTCPPFVASTRSAEELHSKYKDRVHFYLVYVREAHPIDGRKIANNQFQVKSPQTLEERQTIARDFAERLEISIPVLVDTIDDKVERAYSCWPNRMYIIGADGQIADKGTAGPGGVASSVRRAPDMLDSLLEEGK